MALVRLCVLGFLCVLVTPSLRAQTRRDGRLLITVADQTGAILSGATVKVDGQDAGNRSVAPDAVLTSDQGVAAVAGLPPGRYVVQAAFPGFDTGIVKDVRVRTGDNKETIVLQIEKLKDEITVERDKQEAAADANSVCADTGFSASLRQKPPGFRCRAGTRSSCP